MRLNRRPSEVRPAPGTDPGLSEDAVLAAAGRRDPVAVATLFDGHHKALHRFLSRLDNGSADIDDLVHATFVEALRCAPRFRGTSSLRTWLFGIAVNVARHHARGERRRRAFLRTLQLHPRNDSVMPDSSLEHRQMIERLDLALTQLPYERRAAFLLCDVEELSGAEAAQALAAPAGTVGRWLHEARTVLRATLKEGSP